MKKIKAILCDFDGTLVDGSYKYSLTTKNLINKIVKKGVRFSLATGRAYYGTIENIVNTLDIKGIHILHGGGLIYDSENKKIIWEQEISKASTAIILDYFLQKRFFFVVETKNYLFLPSTKNIPDFLQVCPQKSIKQYSEKERILKMTLTSDINKFSEKEIDSYKKYIESFLSDVSVIKFKFGDSYGLDITSEKSTKHTAVLEYIKFLELSKERVVGIGDGLNDYPLFTASGFKIAMGNAHKELKEIADLVVSPLDEGGIEEALEYILKHLL